MCSVGRYNMAGEGDVVGRGLVGVGVEFGATDGRRKMRKLKTRPDPLPSQLNSPTRDIAFVKTKLRSHIFPILSTSSQRKEPLCFPSANPSPE